ncbi:putative tyrosinase-like protein tyr-3 [Mercenaria mercenaria]|uniref:putative tyrosinase-like protein tyr-3 n=1 Tax=Mercenaria mercenaria TaxID=6596 RepID=UPI00234EF36F|nr:putative tyrosinase-like protein tyr-3 [Mercenaria mercenaria]
MYKSGTLRAFGRLHSEVNKKAHKGAAFLVWHRVFLTHFEEEMRKIDPSVSLPYWDSSADFYIAKPTESVVWSDCFMGSGNGAISGYFENFYGTHYSYITRNASRDCKGKLISLDDVNKLLQFCHFKVCLQG